VKPIVLLSKCIGYEACRYDGQVIKDGFVERLAPFVTFITVCPEVEIGMGTPRAPVRLVRDGDELRMVQPDTGKDFTGRMNRFARNYVRGMQAIDGAVLKGRSPSCGIRDAKVYATADKGPTVAKGPGLFASEVLKRFPGAAIEDEGRLRNFRIREHFLTKLFLHARFRALVARASMRALVRFQAENKLLLMAYHQAELRKLGRIVANHDKRPLEAVLDDYEAHLGHAFDKPARYTSHINVLMHTLGYFSKELTAPERKHFIELLSSYRVGRIPLSAVISVCRSWLARFGDDYLDHQSYFTPYPEELVEITDSGKGRGKL